METHRMDKAAGIGIPGAEPRKPSRALQTRFWRQLQCSGEIPAPRSGAASVIVENKMYMFGGYGGNGRLDDFFEYDFETRAWREVKYTGDSPGARENNGVVEYKGCLYLFGGYNGSNWLNDFHEFSLETCVWKDITPSGPAPASRFGYVSVVHKDNFVLFGGYDGSTWLNDMHQFSFTTHKWTAIEAGGQVPSIRSCPSWTKKDQYAYVFGGYDGVQRMNDFFRCDLETYTWTLIVPLSGVPPSPRYFHACCMYANSMFTFGGYNGSERLNDMYEFNFSTGAWTTVVEDLEAAAAAPLQQQQQQQQQQGQGEMQLQLQRQEHDGGGGGGGGGLQAMLHAGAGAGAGAGQLSPQQQQQQQQRAGLPSGRSSLVAEVYNNSLFVFGGYNGAVVLNDFYEFRFEPVVIPPPTLLSDLRSLVNNPQFSDVVFLVEGERVYASRAHLGVRSERFRAMLYGGMREERESEIPIPDVSLPVFLHVLEFLYTDQVGDVAPDLAVPLLIAAEQYLLDRLKALCEDRIRSSITPDNVVSIFIAAHRHRAAGLKDIGLEFILEHLEEVKLSSAFQELKGEPELLMEIIMRQAM